MLEAHIVREIRRLLVEEGMSQRQAARRMRVSRGTVARIAHGKRRDDLPLPESEPDDWYRASGPPTRCGGCGGMVRLPCRACTLRARPAPSAAVRRARVDPPDAVHLELNAEHAARYRAVRAAASARRMTHPGTETETDA